MPRSQSCTKMTEPYYTDDSDDDEPRCTLTAGSACYCTGRTDCQAVCADCGQPKRDCRCGDEGDGGGPWPPGVVTIDTGGLL